MITFDSLPFDVIEYILNLNSITHVDLCHLACVSNLFNCITNSNKLWRKKFSFIWPELSSLYDAHDTNWKQEFRLRFEFQKHVSRKLLEMSIEYHYHDHLSDEAFDGLQAVAHSHPRGAFLLINELEKIINDPNKHTNLTRKYYAEKALRFARLSQLEAEWKNFMYQPSEKASLVDGLCLLSQWSQPCDRLCTAEVIPQISAIAKQVLEKMQKKYPNHPAVQQGLTNNNVLTESQWPPERCKEVLECINVVLFKELKFSCTEDATYNDSIRIEKVLAKRTGFNMVIGAIYAAVAARLGVACLFEVILVYFRIKWMENPNLPGDKAYTFIDLVNDGTFLTHRNLLRYGNMDRLHRDLVKGMSATKVLYDLLPRILLRVEAEEYENSIPTCETVKLLRVMEPSDNDYKQMQATGYLEHGINLRETVSLLQDAQYYSPEAINNIYQEKLRQLIERSTRRKALRQPNCKDVKFAVGMIMKHRKYNYRCVIFGWDKQCTASRDWIVRMGVHNLPRKDKQPFYNVLAEDGTTRYAAQENLEMDRKYEPVSHKDVPRYFDSFDQYCYRPNVPTQAEYPDDDELREKAVFLTELKEKIHEELAKTPLFFL